MNLVVSNLVQEYLLSLYMLVSTALEAIYELELKNKQHIEKLASNSPFDEIQNKLDNSSTISDQELANICQNIQGLIDEASCIQAKISSNEKYLKSVLSCFSNSIDSAIKIYDSNKAEEAKNAIMVSIKFIISSLFPFLSGVDSIHQIIKSRSIKFSNANSYFCEMNEYWNSCFAHAVTTKYLEELLSQYFLKQSILHFARQRM